MSQIITGSQVVAEARLWMGTPFVHQGRVKGVGVDCIGLVIGVGRALGIFPSDYERSGYGRTPFDGTLEREIAERFSESLVEHDRDGTVALIRFDGEPQHVALITCSGNLIHCHARIGKGRVVEHRYADVWRARTTAVYELPGVLHGQ